MDQYADNFLGLQEEDKGIVPFEKLLLSTLLRDRTTRRNIRWATDYYSRYGEEFTGDNPICINQITGSFAGLIKPRLEKSKAEQASRSRQNAEVFTPSWLCNVQNNLVDNAWFERENVFNREGDKCWSVCEEKIQFPEGKTWQDYVLSVRLEVSCGEAPYLVSRYDTVSGNFIAVSARVGLLDRKLRVVGENTTDEKEWLKWAKKAVQSVYGYDWQGDNVLLARKNLLYTVDDFYFEKFGKHFSNEQKLVFARILIWNIWQMDGLKFVVPNSCETYKIVNTTIFGDVTDEKRCLGCSKKELFSHNGIYCKIMDWEKGRPIRFVDMMGGGGSHE